jgi:hypothetical protein
MNNSLSNLRVKSFYQKADKLRDFFESQFIDASSLEPKRFVWDYWHVENQYNLIRTPAYHYFPSSMYMDWHKKMVHWGRKNLGCWDITPPWLSYYVHGCFQNLHADVPHGPWAFVFSLTKHYNKKLNGGETFLLKSNTLNYWSQLQSKDFHQEKELITKLPPNWNQLLVFDPRIPHGVTSVHGTKNPLHARLVIHSWFTHPKTYVEGSLPAKKTQDQLNEVFSKIEIHSTETAEMQGSSSILLKVSANGSVQSAKFLSCQFQPKEQTTAAFKSLKRFQYNVLNTYLNTKFTKSKGPSEITIPLILS